jgi:hypothetical protein
LLEAMIIRCATKLALRNPISGECVGLAEAKGPRGASRFGALGAEDVGAGEFEEKDAPGLLAAEGLELPGLAVDEPCFQGLSA